jgi:hypothetical protein
VADRPFRTKSRKAAEDIPHKIKGSAKSTWLPAKSTWLRILSLWGCTLINLAPPY